MDEVEVFEYSPQEWGAAMHRALDSVGMTYDELEAVAKTGRFPSYKHRKVWHVVRKY